MARIQARIILQGVFVPLIEGFCSSWGVSPEEGLQILIEEKADFGKIARDNPQDLEKMLNDPVIKATIKAVGSLKDVTDEWIKEKMDVLLEVMMDIKPELARGIIDTPGGLEWFFKSLTGLRDVLFEGQNEVSNH